MSDQHRFCAMFPSPYLETRWAASEHPLLPRLAKGLAEAGWTCIQAPPYCPSVLWLLRSFRRVRVMHLHWPEQYYWPRQWRPLDFFCLACSKFGLRWLEGAVRALFLLRLYSFIGVAHVLRMPFVWTVHDLYPHGQTRDRHFYAEKWARRLLVKHAAAILVNGSAAIPLVRAEFGEPKRCAIAPLGSYREFYPEVCSRAEARRQLNFEEGQVVFLSLGSMRDHRNPLELVGAFTRLRGDHLRLLVVGSGPTRLTRQIERAAWEDWRIRCFFQRVSNEEIDRLLKACDFVVMPGHEYLTSAVMNLAVSFGRPTIAPDFGCAREIAGGAAILYDDSDPQGLSGALCTALAQGPESLTRQAEVRAASLSWTATARAIALAYESAITAR